MKGLWILACLVFVIATGLYWLSMRVSVQDHGHLIAYAVGSPGGDTLEIEIVVSFSMTGRDPPRLKPNGKMQTWKEWMADHLELRDDTGQRVTLRNSDFTNVIPKGKVGTPNFYAIGQVEADTDYTFVYYPRGKAGPERYRHTFRPTAEGKPFERARFVPVG